MLTVVYFLGPTFVSRSWLTFCAGLE